MCLVFMNNLDHYQRLISRVRSTIGDIPQAWRVDQTPVWMEDVMAECRVLETDVVKTQEAATKLRSLVSSPLPSSAVGIRNNTTILGH